MCTVLLPPGVYPSAVKYIISYIYIYIYIYIYSFFYQGLVQIKRLERYHSLRNNAVAEVGMAKNSVLCGRLGDISIELFRTGKEAGT
jgi:hypothetical protein